MLYIGIDLGTSSVKLLLMDSSGKIVNIVTEEYPVSYPHPGWSEQRPEDWYEKTVAGVRKLIREAARPGDPGQGRPGNPPGDSLE